MKLISQTLMIPVQACSYAQAALQSTAGRALSLWPLPVLDLSDGHGWFEEDEL